MKALVWKHGQSIEQVRRVMQERLLAAGISDKVAWQGNRFTASVGWGSILNLAGEIRPETIELDRCSGAIGGVVMTKCRDAFGEMFPAGEELPVTGLKSQQPVS